MPKYFLWLFLILAVVSIPGGRIPFHPLTEIKCIIYLIFSIYPLKFFFSNYSSIKHECKLLTYAYLYNILFCILGIFKMFFKETGLYPVDTYQSITASLAFGWFFVSLKKPSLLYEFINFSLKKWPIVFIFLLLPFYNVGFIRSYLFFLLPFILLYKYASFKVKLTFLIFLFFFYISPGQRLNLLYIITVFIVIIIDKLSLLSRVNQVRNIIIICFLIPILSIILYLSIDFNVLDFNSYIYSEQQYGSENLFEDTRTFLYEESIYSIIKNGTWLFGETPAFGYTSLWYTNYVDSNQIISRLSEAGIVNIYVWFGIIGLIGYTALIFYICKISLKSKSKIIWLLSIYISIYYMISWIGNCNIWVTNSRIILFIIMGFIYYSVKNNMSHKEIENYFKKTLKD